LLVLGAGGSVWQAIRAIQAETLARENEAMAREIAAAEATQRNRAEKNEQQAKTSEAEAKAVLKFFQDKVLVAGRPEGPEGGLGRNVTLRQAVDAAVPAIAAAFPQQPLAEASIRNVLGVGYDWLGELPLAAQHLERALSLRQANLGPD